MPRLKTTIGPLNDRRTLEGGTLNEVTALLACFKSPATVTDRDERTVKDFLLPRSTLNAVPLMLDRGIVFDPNDLFNLSNLVGTLDDPTALLGKLQALHDQGLSLTAQGPHGNTLLHRYALCFNDRVFEYLVHAGVDPTLKNARGETALHALVQRLDDTSTDFFQCMPPPAMMQVEHVFARFSRKLGQPLPSRFADQLTDQQRTHAQMVAWAERFMQAGCRPQDLNVDGKSVFDLVRPSQHRWEAAVQAMTPSAHPGTAFMLVMAGKNHRRPEQYSPAHLALLERLEAAAGMAYLDRSPLVL